MKALGLAAAIAAVSLVSQVTRAEDPVDAKAAFATLKSLAGEWKAEGEGDQKVIYKVTANGSVVMETLFPGTNHEMVSMYHLDGNDLKMTHYCGAGNQPHTKFDPKGSKSDFLVFAFDGGTNFDPAKDTHMHEGRIKIKDSKHIETEWDGYTNGKKAGSHKVVLSKQ